MAELKEQEIISQAVLDELLHINDFIDQRQGDSLVSELKEAILDSGKLSLKQWQGLREHLYEIEELIPHIDFIIKLKRANDK